jgi:hypothetical protein
MPRFATPLFLLVTLYAGAVSAASPAANPLSCDAFLKRACSKQEQANFDRGTQKPAVTARADAPRDCDSLLGRTCSKQERAHFAKGVKPAQARPASLAHSCDNFLKRPCNKQEQLGFAKGTRAPLALASN